MITTILVILLVFALLGGGLGYYGAPGSATRYGGYGIGGIVVLICLFLALTGRL